MRTRVNFNLIVCAMLLIFSGCASVGVPNRMRPSEKNSTWNLFKPKSAQKTSWGKKKEIVPEKMVVIWKDARLEGSPPIKGFGARIYFYDRDDNPVTTDGELVVYGFDDLTSEEEASSRQPKKKFVFTGEQFQTHFSESDLGPSYSVWIPWEKAGGYHKTVALLPIFKTKEGKLLNGGMSNNALPGKSPDTDQFLSNRKTRPSQPQSGVTQVGFSADSGSRNQANLAVLLDEDSPAYRIQTSTIPLTPMLSDHFSNSTPQQNEAAKSDITSRSATARQNKLKSGEGGGEKETGAPNLESVTATTAEKTGSAAPPKSGNKLPVFGYPGSFR